MFFFIEFGLDAKFLQDFGNRMHILKCRNLIEQTRRVLSQKSRRDNRQNRILRPADLDAALQPASAMYNQLFHLSPFSSHRNAALTPAAF